MSVRLAQDVLLPLVVGMQRTGRLTAALHDLRKVAVADVDAAMRCGNLCHFEADSLPCLTFRLLFAPSTCVPNGICRSDLLLAVVADIVPEQDKATNGDHGAANGNGDSSTTVDRLRTLTAAYFLAALEAVLLLIYTHIQHFARYVFALQMWFFPSGMR